MELKFSEYDIRDLLSKVTVFETSIGNYQFFTVNEQFSYLVKVSNGTIHFTVDELIANKEQRISREQLTLIASRFTKSSSSGPQRRRDSAIPDEYAQALGTSEPKKMNSKVWILLLGVIMVLGMAGAMVFLMREPESAVPTYPTEQPDPGDTVSIENGSFSKLSNPRGIA